MKVLITHREVVPVDHPPNALNLSPADFFFSLEPKMKLNRK